MATESGFGEQAQTLAQTLSGTTPSGGRAGKRKRNVADNPSRPSPSSRRNNQPGNEELMSENDINFLRNSTADFGSAQPEGDDTVDTAAAALNYTMQQPATAYPLEKAADHPAPQHDAEHNTFDNLVAAVNSTGDDEAEQQGDDQTAGEFPESPQDSGKPKPGTEEWNRLRKDNHKEVERRRRETINDGINELARIVPNCDKNKGSILQRVAQYIGELRAEASQNIDKWTFEKLVTEQAINDLSSKLKSAWAQKEAWKRAAKEAGVDVDNYDLGIQSEDEPEASKPAKKGAKGKAKAPAAVTAQVDEESSLSPAN